MLHCGLAENKHVMASYKLLKTSICLKLPGATSMLLTFMRWKRFVHQMRWRRKHTNIPRIISAESMEDLSKGGMVAIPELSTLERNVWRWWQVNENAPSILTSFDFDISEEYQQIKIGEREHQLLLYDSERILIFGTMDEIKTLKKSETWATDGTFKSCPKIFFQFLTVHVVNKSMYIPRIFALLPNKREDT